MKSKSELPFELVREKKATENFFSLEKSLIQKKQPSSYLKVERKR